MIPKETGPIFVRLLIVAAFLTGCVEQDAATVYFPVLDACEADASSQVQDAAGSRLLTARIVSFDGTFRSHPEVAGFVEVTSTEVPHDELISFARGFAQECLPELEATFDKSNRRDASRLFDLLNAIGRRELVYQLPGGRPGPVDPNRIYLRDEGSEVRVFFFLED